MSRPRATVYHVKPNGWCTARVTKGSGEAQYHETIAVNAKYRFRSGDVIVAKVKRNVKGDETWFATFAEAYLPRTTQVHHEDWQDGPIDQVITVPDTVSGSPHDGIELECWKCGNAKVHGHQIHRIKQTAVWTNTTGLEGCTIHSKKSRNKFKDCFVQSVKCSCCNEILGSFYRDPYTDKETGRIKEGQVFPCFKLDHMRTHRGDEREFSLVLKGGRSSVLDAIKVLVTTDDAPLVQRFARCGRIDAVGFDMIKEDKAARLKLEKEREKATREAEQKRREAEAAAAATARAAEVEIAQKKRDAQRRVHLAELEVNKARAQAKEFISEADRKKNEAEELERAAQVTAEKRLRDADRATHEAIKAAEQAEALRAEAAAEANVLRESAAEQASKQRREAEDLIAEAQEHKKKAEEEQKAARKALETAEEEKVKAVRSLVAPLPTYWTPGHKPIGTETVVDVTHTTLRERMQWLMNKTAIPGTHGCGRDSHGCGFDTFQVEQVERIENFRLWSSYATKRAQLHAVAAIEDVPTTQLRLPYGQDPKFDDSKNEFYLFHGTITGDIADIIKKDGFDFRLCSREGMLGQGLYFAESASKSDQYTGKESDLYMFLSRVVMGTPHCTDIGAKYVRPPCVSGCDDTVCHHDRTDSVLFSSAAKHFKEFVVYDNSQCYPEYLIRYRRK